ncbi:MAG: ankyrin repeat domain-containing protein [Candidatus Eremiobacteraeota bacterium]|nr:ankyrin repeat domain-containing protein [Candidatus Eremiobacteraeota bacterium]
MSNEKEGESKTPLHLLVSYELVEMVKLLIPKGASVNEKDKYGNTATLVGNNKIANKNSISIFHILEYFKIKNPITL